MNPLLAQFIQEGREFLEGIGEKLIALESQPDSAELMTELFRLVHTLKGNSGLFDLPEMTRVLHAGEDLMDAVRDGRVAYSRDLADRLLDAMDFVAALLDEIEGNGVIRPENVAPSEALARSLRGVIPARAGGDPGEPAPASLTSAAGGDIALPDPAAIPEAVRIDAWRAAVAGKPLVLVGYRPDEECFFKGEDPFHQARQTPGLLWGTVAARAPWPGLDELDCYRCQLDFHMLAAAPRTEIDEYFRYTPEQVGIRQIEPYSLVVPAGDPNGGPVYGDFVGEALELLATADLGGLDAAAVSLLELSSPDLWLSSVLRWLRAIIAAAPAQREVMRRLIESLNTLAPPVFDIAPQAAPAVAAPAAAAEPAAPAAQPDRDLARICAILKTQAEILALPEGDAWQPGRVKAVAATVAGCVAALGDAPEQADRSLAAALAAQEARPLREWLEAYLEGLGVEVGMGGTAEEAPAATPAAPAMAVPIAAAASATQAAESPAAPPSESDVRFGRRAEDALVGKVLKVDQAKVDRLMNLIGEMVVAKNALPYLAGRADNQYGVRELAREIKAQYAVINRIAEEMQDAIMQVRMMPVSFIFQRFPRLVRDTSRKLGKEVELVLEGEETEADKNVIEALADPLIHIVRNSLDHGLEQPEVRAAAGKPRSGKLHIRAAQESDRVVIEIADDGRGIDPQVIKRKACEKGVIDVAQMERISDQEAVNLVFAAGFSTAEAVTDLSGRGVGMDVVRNAIDKVGGTVELRSVVGRGTTLRLSLPLSMAVTNVMIVESDHQIFGVPMDLVVETVRLPRADIRTIKRQKTTVLRGRIVPLVTLNELLAVPAEPVANADDELAALVVRVGSEPVGLLVDNFREVVDVILKPLPGELARLSCYAGSALLGDGSVLMVLNPKELF